MQLLKGKAYLFMILLLWVFNYRRGENMLNQRQLCILNHLIESNTYCSARSIAQKQKMSIRTIQTDIGIIKEVLKESEFIQFSSVPSKGTMVQVIDKGSLTDFILNSESVNRHYDMQSKSSRINRIIVQLFCAHNSVSLNHLADRIFVSRSTLLSDLQEVREVLKPYEISVSSDSQGGFYVIGNEIDIRRYIVNENLNQYLDFTEYSFLGTTVENMEKIRDILVQVLNEYEYQISDIGLQNLIIHVDIIVRRIKLGFFLEDTFSKEVYLKFEREIKISDEIFKRCSKKFAIEYIGAEVVRLAIYLRGKADYSENSYITEEIDSFVTTAIEEINIKFGIDFIDDVGLRISLSLHLVPLLIRLKYNMQQKNELVNNVSKTFQLAFDIASLFSYNINNKYNYQLIEDEIAYFALYFNNALNNIEENMGTSKVLIISSLKRSETLLLRERINHWFSKKIKSLDIRNIYEVEDLDLTKYEVICTTEKNNYYEEGIAILISQFPTETDYRQIRMKLDGFKEKNDILELFKEKLVITDHFKDKEEVINRLCDEIVVLDGKSLIKESVFQREEMGGTYFYNYVAMPHPMHPITQKTYIAVAILEKPVIWDDNDNMANIVFLISLGKDNPSVFQLWGYLSEMIRDEKSLQSIIANPSFDNFIINISKSLDAINWELREY